MSEGTILVIEDDADIRNLLHFNLEKEGFTSIEAGDGVTGLAMAREQKPSLVLLDLMLPGMDGFEVCRRLGSSPDTAEIPVLMLTARGEEMDRVVGLSLGADDYVVKPFSVRELMLRVRAVLRRRKRPENGPVERHGIRLDPEAPQGDFRRKGSRPHGYGIPPPGGSHAPRRRCPLERAASGQCLGLYVRGVRQNR